MSHFRCPNSNLMSAAGYYAYHQPHPTLSESSTSESRPRAASTSSATGRRVVILDEDKDSTVSSSSSSSSSSSTILAPRTQTRQPANDSTQWIAHESSQRTQPLPPHQLEQQQRQQWQQQQQPTIATTTTTAAAAAVEDEDEDSKRCWICFGEDEDTEGKWVKPCKCSLVSHEKCLLTWIEETQRGSPMKKVRFLINSPKSVLRSLSDTHVSICMNLSVRVSVLHMTGLLPAVCYALCLVRTAQCVAVAAQLDRHACAYSRTLPRFPRPGLLDADHEHDVWCLHRHDNPRRARE